MKATFIHIVLFFFLLFSSHAQQLDSVKYNNGYLYFHHYGKGETIILLTGGPGTDYSYLDEMAIKTGKYFHVVLTEQRGTGRSIPTRFDSTTINLSTAIDDIKLLIDHLKLKEVTLIGHSWGASLAMEFAAKYPALVKSLILIDPGSFQNFESASNILTRNQRSRLGKSELKQFDSLSSIIKYGKASATDSIERRKILLLTYVYDKNKADSISDKILVPNSPITNELLTKDRRKNSKLSQTLNRYTGPIDIICGRQDGLAFNSYELKLFRPSVSIHWIEESGHYPMYEQPEAFYSVLFKVLSKK
jgi:proline iminopeptidase